MRNYSIRFLLDIRSESVNVPGSHKKTGAEASVLGECVQPGQFKGIGCSPLPCRDIDLLGNVILKVH